MEATRDLAPKVTLDTSAVITAFEAAREGHSSMRHLIEASQAGKVALVVSQRTLDELREKSDEKLAFAESLEVHCRVSSYLVGLPDHDVSALEVSRPRRRGSTG